MTVTRSVVLGCGSYLPERTVTNADLAKTVDTSDEWIVQRTGIRERHIAADGEFTSDLGLKAARAALDNAKVDAQSIDLIVVGTSTPDNTFPATAVAIQAALGINARRGVRSAGGVLGLRLCDGDRQRPVAHRRAQARAGDRRGNLLAHPRLDRSRHLRAVRRRRRRDRDGRAGAAGHARRPRHPRPRICAPTGGTSRSSMSTAARPRPARSGTCAWKAKRCSSSRSAPSPT